MSMKFSDTNTSIAFTNLLNAAGGDMRLVERALSAAADATDGRAPSFEAVKNKIDDLRRAEPDGATSRR